jgi:hypothetical protein
MSASGKGFLAVGKFCWLSLFFLVNYGASASTITLSTSDPSVVAQLGKAGQGWWSKDTFNIATNTNYSTGTSFSVSPGVDYSYRSFFTFDFSSPVLQGYTITGATLQLQAFLGTGFNDGGQISFFDVTTSPTILNNTVGLATESIWDDLGNGALYGIGQAGSPRSTRAANSSNMSASTCQTPPVNFTANSG